MVRFMLFMLIFFTRRARKLKSEILCDFEKDWIAVPGKWFLFKKEVLNKDFLEKKKRSEIVVFVWTLNFGMTLVVGKF